MAKLPPTAMAVIAILSGSAVCPAQSANWYGVVESYFNSNATKHGFNHMLSWAELNGRITPEFRVTGSYLLYQGGSSWDELYAQFERKQYLVRAGRIRTAFGFSNWSELFYNGFNHLPIMKTKDLVDQLSLARQDSGVEVTAWNGLFQIQAAVIDTDLGDQQIQPRNLNFESLRLQSGLGQLILGLDYLTKGNGSEKIYGLDARYTFSHWNIRGEAMKGDGPTAKSGYYLDAWYRIPSLVRTQIVYRNEGLYSPGNESTFVNTAGLRQIVTPNLTLNVNYGWGTGFDSGYGVKPGGLVGWSARAMFQVQF